jgi:hypothetical protein
MAKGLFIGFSEKELLQARDNAKAAILNGGGQVIVNYSDSGTSVSKSWTLTPDVILDEVRYALKLLDPLTYGRRRRWLSADNSGREFV